LLKLGRQRDRRPPYPVRPADAGPESFTGEAPALTSTAPATSARVQLRGHSDRERRALRTPPSNRRLVRARSVAARCPRQRPVPLPAVSSRPQRPDLRPNMSASRRQSRLQRSHVSPICMSAVSSPLGSFTQWVFRCLRCVKEAGVPVRFSLDRQLIHVKAYTADSAHCKLP